MSSALKAEDCLIIAGWRLEEDRHCLVREGEAVKLEPRATQLLAYMARHAQQPLSRQDLLETVWQGTVVSDEVLTTAINKIRRAFGDDRHHPRVIETIPKMGYRLIAPVQKGSADISEPSSSAVPSPSATLPEPGPAVPHPPIRLGKKGLLWIVTIVVICGLAIASLIITRQGTEDARPPRAGPAVRPAVAVWPFEVLGDDPEQQYLARGLTTDLIAQLSRLSGIVASTASAIANPPDDDAQQTLDERYEVWGGMRRDGEQLKVEVRLIESKSGRQLWVERYERPFGDLFDVQQEISTRLAQTLSVQVNDVERARLAQRYTRSVAAYDLFLRAQSELLVRRKENNVRAEELYLQAVGIDPSFAAPARPLLTPHEGSSGSDASSNTPGLYDRSGPRDGDRRCPTLA